MPKLCNNYYMKYAYVIDNKIFCSTLNIEIGDILKVTEVSGDYVSITKNNRPQGCFIKADVKLIPNKKVTKSKLFKKLHNIK